MSLYQNIADVEEKIDKYCNKAGVSRKDINLIAVSKTVGWERVKEAYDDGLRSFGENYVREFVEKSQKLPEDIEWNIIGQLQRNKVKYIMNNKIYLLHSLDKLSLADELQKQCLKHDKYIDVLVQLNLSGEETKSGISQDELDGFLEAIASLDRIKVKGIMTIGPTFGDEAEIRKDFASAKKIFDKLKNSMSDIQYLSMGMTGDFGWAILEGSNMIRVGTAIFGKRDYNKA